MKKLLTLFLIFSFSILFSQTNNPAPYCGGTSIQGCCQPGPPNFGGNFVNHFIHNFITTGAYANINNLNSGCNGLNGYAYFCNQYLGTMPGQVITCSVQLSNLYSQGLAVFIDWNQDNVFTLPAETIYASPGVLPFGAWVTYTFMVPLAQPTGVYRLRARCAGSTPGVSMLPCNTVVAGEIEDYNIYVGIPAPGPTTITPTAYTVCPTSMVGLSATGGGPYLWSNGQTQPNTAVAVSQNTVVYISVQQGSCAIVNAVSLTAAPLVTVSAGSNSNICYGTSATISASGANTYTIDPGGFVTQSVVVTPTANTVYTVAGSNGYCSGTSTVFVQVLPQIFLNQTPSLVCSGNLVSLIVSGAAQYTWQPGNLIGGIQFVTPTVTTIYTLTAVQGPCTRSVTVPINVAPLPTIMPTSNNNPSCPGSAVTLSASGGNTYTWNPGGVGSTVAVSPTTQTIYTVTGNDGTCQAAAYITQSITPGPTVTANSNSSVICSGNSVTLTASGAPSYLWSNGNSSFSIVVSPTVTTTYTVTGIQAPCTGSTIITQSVNPIPTLTVQCNPTLICVGNSATISANGANNYTWTPGGTGSVIVVSPTITTTYTIDGESSSCIGSAVITQSVDLCTGIIERVPADHITIYPNPFQDEFFIGSKKLMDVNVFDMQGKNVYHNKAKGPLLIDSSTWTKGIYLFNIRTEEGVTNYKLLKN